MTSRPLKLIHVCQIWVQSGVDWHPMGQIREFYDQISVHFGSASQNVLKADRKIPRFVPLGANLTHLGVKSISLN